MAKTTPDTPDTPQDFEASLAELETLVSRMEGGDISLEESLAAFERGVQLTRECQKALAQAEQRVNALTAGSDQLQPFDTGTDDAP